MAFLSPTISGQSHERTLVTRFGDIAVNRRYYQDDHGTYHYLLDEYLSWRPNHAATPSLTEALVDSATGSTFRRVSREVQKYTAGVISASEKDLWFIKEEGFNEDLQGIRESQFSIGNGFLGMRGVLEEKPKGARPGTFVAGIYDRITSQVSEMVNFPNPFYGK